MNTSTQPRMLDALTGLRFVAAFCVFLHHAKARLSIEWWNLGPLGGFSVGFFFVLSGFILMHVYGKTLKTADIPRFFAARFARIWPVHAVCLLLFLLLFRWNSPPTSPDELVRMISQVCLTQTWGTKTEEILGFNGVAWSISVEAFFYALFPFLCLMRDRSFSHAYAAIAVSTVLSVVVAEWSVGLHPEGRATALSVLQFTPPMRLLEFATGIATARVAARWTSFSAAQPARDSLVEVAALGLVAMGFLVFGPAQWIRHAIAPHSLPLAQQYLPKGAGFAPAFALLILWMARSRGAVAWLLSRRPMIYLGEISFSFYMVHAMVLMLVARSGVGTAAQWPLGFTLALAGSLAAASVLHTLVEVPMREIILAVWDGKFANRWRTLMLAPFAGVRRGSVVASIATLALCPWVLREAAAAEKWAEALRRIEATDPDLRGVVFSDEAEILAANGRIEGERFSLAVVYDPLPASRRALFTHVTAPDGKILRHIVLRDVEFVAQDGRVLRLASAEVPVAQLDGASSVGIGFWSQALGASKANRGPLTMGGHRLEVFAVP